MIAFAVTALGIALLTWALGWWGVVVAALVAGAVLWRRRGVAWIVAVGAVAAWGALIVVNSVGGRFATLASSVAGVMQLPAAVLLIVTLLFGALLAWSAAVVGSEIGRLLRHERASA